MGKYFIQLVFPNKKYHFTAIQRNAVILPAQFFKSQLIRVGKA